MTEEYENMTVSELKEILKEKGLPVSGTKKTLIERLSEDSETNETLEDIEEEIQEDEFDEEYEDFEDDDWDDEELGIHVTKQKPELDASTLSALKLRNLQSKSTPTFRRTEWFRYKRLSKSGWRRPKGMDNSQRKNLRYRGSKVRIGHGKISTARGLHPSGFREVMVHNPLDLEKINPANEAARIGATVGGRKREQIHLKADELGIRILNRRRNL
ncbi:MAG: 50S ribosomal protein L32e [Methanobacteriota archaeon]|nr:MAG: 50S ribosomal protein L32e [Euryarchaeota archaeon]|tara:strand:+ start:8243 stop:8887 length:645 start_codon:yes stop_codon:yes gene_type:complete